MSTLLSCPKCGHRPLPEDQAFPAACPACGVILARVGTRPPPPPPRDRPDAEAVGREPPAGIDPMVWWARAAALAAFALWGVALVRLDLAEGEIMDSFLHRPLLVFHEAGHVIFRVFGEWMGVAGGTLGQLLMPAVMAVALGLKGDRFGAALGTWLLGVSMLDVAPYVYDALHPQLTLLTGGTGDTDFHDWVWLLGQGNAKALLHAQGWGRAWHAAGTAVVAASVGWGAWELKRQHARLDRRLTR